MRPQTYLDLLDPLAQAPVSVHPERCVLVRNRHATCARCAEACTSGCISQVDGRVTVDPELCVGCGTCATVCPTGALEPCDPTDRELYEACRRAMGADGRVTVACERAGLADNPAAVRVRCLGRVDESLLALLARAGAREVELVHGACEGCRERPGLAVAEQVCATANALLAAWGQPPMARVVQQEGPQLQGKPVPEEEGAAGSERAVPGECETPGGCEASNEREVPDGCASQSGPAGEQAKAAVPPQRVKGDGTLPHALPNRRNRLLQALNGAFGEPDPQTPVETRLWGHVAIDVEACRSCTACAVFCPTEALRKVENGEGSVSLHHYPSRCVKCGCCADVCPTGALVLHDEVAAADLRPGACTVYELPPRSRARGPHQMRDAMAGLLGCDFIYER